jgi:hypothetical protein
MKDYTYFGPNKLSFLDSNNVEQTVPDLVARAAKNYRYNHATQKLEKKCITCKKYFEVQLYGEGKFWDIHDEEEIHYFSEKSGYDTRCKKCNLENKSDIEEQSSNKEYYQLSNEVSDENITYIRIVAAIEQISEKQCMNHLLDVIRKNNTLTYEYKRKIN